ncbi:MAG: SPOR domain-containing protein [Pseudomonadales bacterium]
MNDGLRQRLVGAAVFILLGFIFWPIIMGPEEERDVVLESRLPELAELERFTVEEPVRPADVEGVGSYRQALVAEQESLALEADQATREKAEAVVIAQEDSTPGEEVADEPSKTSSTVEPLSLSVEDAGSDGAGIIKGWVVQVGGFSSDENAAKLQLKLQTKQYHSYVQPRSNDKDLLRVMVGPVVDPEEAERLKVRLKKELKLEGRIIRYIPYTP